MRILSKSFQTRQLNKWCCTIIPHVTSELALLVTVNYNYYYRLFASINYDANFHIYQFFQQLSLSNILKYIVLIFPYVFMSCCYNNNEPQ